MLRRPELASLLLPLAMLAACAASTGGKGTEDGLPGGGKADGFTDLVDHGALRFGASSDAEIAKGALFHAWTFDLSDNADVSVRTEKLSTNLDTVMYLYRRSPGASSWGSYIAKNDDAGGSAASKVQGAFEPGEYRVVVKSFKDTNLGTFSLFGECAGAGCPASGPFGGQCDESTPRSLPSPTGYTENCTHSLAYLLNAHVVSQSKTTVELGSQCSGDPVAALAAEYYMGYWQDIGVWEDYIEGADPVELEVETTSLGEDGYIVSADFQWGDETALSFVFNGAGDLL
ncbi:MAG: hypothetical protein KC417_15325, partial [Myxococcales bacterium]|nr:hypothetical protein [Myxococcales bacterium]